jgi:hypothetical protein
VTPLSSRRSQKPRLDLLSLPLDEVVACVCLEQDLNEAQLRVWNRPRLTAEASAMMAWLVVQTGRVPLTAMGQHFTRDVTTLSMTVRRLT